MVSPRRRDHGILVLTLMMIAAALSASVAGGTERASSARDGRQEPPITAMAIAPGKDLLLCGSQTGIAIDSLSKKTSQPSLSTGLVQVHDLAFLNDGQKLVAAGGSPARQGSLEIWNWNERKRTERWDLHKDLIYRVALSNDGKRLATASHDGTCKVVHAVTGKILTEFAGHSRPVMAIAFLPTNDLVVSAGVDQTVQLWHGATGQLVRSMDNHTAPVNDLAVRPLQKEMLPLTATASEDRTIRLWQPTIGRLVRFAKLASIPRSICWNPPGTELWVGCDDGNLLILDPDDLKVLHSHRALKGRIHAVLPHPDGKQILCAGETGQAAAPR